MTNLERTIDLLTSLALSENDLERETLLNELKKLRGHAMTDSTPVEEQIELLLMELGIPCNLLGYDYIVTGVCELLQHPNLRGSIVRELYPRIAQKHGTTSARAERAIRHAIEVGWDRIDVDVAQKYFSNTVSSFRGKPTNSEFLYTVERIFRQRGK